MYQQGRDRRKTNVNTVGSRHGDSFWQAESANTGLKLLTSMGWKQGDGLGKEGQGTTNAIKAKRKSDNSGIGAKAGDADQHGFAQVATSNFNDLLKRLNEANANNATVKQPDSSDSEDDSISSGVAAIGRSMARNGLYGRFRAAKDVGRYSEDAKAEIFGKRKTVPVSSPPITTQAKLPEPESESSIVTTTATVSMADYFAQKARARAAAASGATTQSFTSVSMTTTTTRGFNENDQTSYYDMISSRAQGSNTRRAGLGAHSAVTQEYHSVSVKKEIIVKDECIKQEIIVKEESVVEETEEQSDEEPKSPKRDRKRVKRDESEEQSSEVDEKAAKRERKRLKKERKSAERANKQESDDE